MAFVTTDWTIAANGDIRYSGDIHGGASPSYVTVIEFHRALQDFADDAAASGDDLLDISSLTPSDRSTDNIITLLNGFNIDDTSAEHLYDGSIIQTGGDDIYDGIVNFGNAAFISVLQNGALIVSDFWNSFTPAGFNANVNQGISHRFMVKTRTAGTDVDGRKLLGMSREYGKTFAEFPINGTSRGNNVLALSESTDLNNATASGTVAAYTLTKTEGYRAIDINNDSIDEYFYVEWDISTAPTNVNDLYEFTKYITRRGTAETIMGIAGDVFRGVTHEIDIDGATGTFVEPEAVSWTGGTGQLLAIDSVTAGTKMWIQLLTGSAPGNDVLITGASTATALVNITVVERPIPQHISGASTGSALISAYGFGVASANLTAADIMTALDNIAYFPPNNVSFTVGGLVSGEDRVLVTLDNGGTIDKAQFTSGATYNTGAVASISVTGGSLPSDLPSSGTFRIVNDAGFDVPITYSSYNAGTGVFTLSGTYDFSGTNETAAATSGNNLYITYIDKIAGASSEVFTVVFNNPRTLFIRVRDGGVSPIKTFQTTGTLGSAGGSTTAIRTADA